METCYMNCVITITTRQHSCCIFLGPFRLCVGIDPMGMQMSVCSVWCLSLNLSRDTYLKKFLCSKLCSLRLFISHQNIFSGMTTIAFLLDF